MVFLYINNELSEREFKKKVPFKITTKNKIPKNEFNHK